MQKPNNPIRRSDERGGLAAGASFLEDLLLSGYMDNVLGERDLDLIFVKCLLDAASQVKSRRPKIAQAHPAPHGEIDARISELRHDNLGLRFGENALVAGDELEQDVKGFLDGRPIPDADGEI